MTPTEKLEANLEKRLAKEYRKARAELTKELNTTLKEFKEKDAWYKDQLGQGKIHQDTYKEWREAQLQHSQWVRDMRDQIAVDLYHVNRVATDMINGASPYAFCESVNYETYKLEHDMKVDTSFTLYSKSTLGALLKEHPSIMPRKVNKKKDTRWNRQNVTSALAQAVLQGDDTKQLAKRLMNVVDMNETSAMLASRTIMNSASNAGKQESIDRAIEAGIPVEKGWLATLDQRTRHSHRHMDMEFVKGNEKFSNGMMFPCDWSADIDNIGAEIYNCRCQMITRIADIPFDMSGRNEKLGDMSYEEWKDKRKKFETTNEVLGVDITKKHFEVFSDDFKNVIPKWAENVQKSEMPSFTEQLEYYKKAKTPQDKELCELMANLGSYVQTFKDRTDEDKMYHAQIFSVMAKPCDATLYRGESGKWVEHYGGFVEGKVISFDSLSFTSPSPKTPETHNGVVFEFERGTYSINFPGQDAVDDDELILGKFTVTKVTEKNGVPHVKLRQLRRR